MVIAYLHAVSSLDGYIADLNDDVRSLHDWYFSGDHDLVIDDHPEVHGARFRVSAASAEYVRGLWAAQSVLVIGRHQFDLTDGWSGHPHTAPSPRAGIPRRRTTSSRASSRRWHGRRSSRATVRSVSGPGTSEARRSLSA